MVLKAGRMRAQRLQRCLMLSVRNHRANIPLSLIAVGSSEMLIVMGMMCCGRSKVPLLSSHQS